MGVINKCVLILSVLFLNQNLLTLGQDDGDTNGDNVDNHDYVDDFLKELNDQTNTTDDSIATKSKNSKENFLGCPSGFECVPYNLCKNNSIVGNEKRVIDIHPDDSKLRECPYLEKCCASGDKTDKPIVAPSETQQGCGYRNADGVGFRISGKGEETEYGEFPWMVAILIKEKDNSYVYKCGGSIIHPQIVLTAAHNVRKLNKEKIIVRAGDWDIQTEDEIFPTQERNVDEIIRHSEFTKKSLHYDIAILYLKSPFEFSDYVNSICLPPQRTKFDNERCIVTGWGKDKYGRKGKYQAILKKVDVPIVPRKQCKEKLRTTKLGAQFKLHKSFICAGGERGKDSCKGDGGSPLICPIKGEQDRYYQVGIVSWGVGCSNENPGVYVSISKLRNWIDEKLALKQIGNKTFTL